MITVIASDSASGLTGATTAGLNTTGADFLIIGLACDDAFNQTPSDSKGNTWTQVSTSYTQTNVRVRMWYAPGTSVGTSHTFTATGGGGLVGCIFALALAGVKQSGAFDQINGANGFASTLATGSITPSENNEICVTVMGINASGTPISINSSFIETNTEINFGAGDHYGGCMAYLIQTTAAAVNPTWTRTNTNGMAAMICSFKVGATAHTKSLSDTMSLADTISKKPSLAKTDAFTLAEVVGKKPVKITTDSMAIAETRASGIGANPADTVAIGDTPVKTNGKSLSDTMAIADTLSALFQMTRTDSMSIAEVLASATGQGVSLTDAITIADAQTRLTGKGLSDTIALSDTLSKASGKPLTDTLVLADSIVKQAGLQRTDSLTIADLIVSASGSTISLTDALTIADSLIKTIGLHRTDTMTIADSLVRRVVKNLLDTIGLTDLFSSIGGSLLGSARIYEHSVDIIKKKLRPYTSKSDVGKKKLY